MFVMNDIRVRLPATAYRDISNIILPPTFLALIALEGPLALSLIAVLALGRLVQRNVLSL